MPLTSVALLAPPGAYARNRIIAAYSHPGGVPLPERYFPIPPESHIRCKCLINVTL
jgi:hypothetical protein